MSHCLHRRIDGTQDHIGYLAISIISSLIASKQFPDLPGIKVRPMAWYPQVQGVDMFAHMRQSEFSARCIDLK